MKKYQVTYRISTAYHPQTNGQVEVTNRELKRILEKTIHHNSRDWSERMDDALWAYQTSFKTQTVHTPYHLVYGKAYHLLVDLEHQTYWATKFLNFDIVEAGQK